MDVYRTIVKIFSRIGELVSGTTWRYFLPCAPPYKRNYHHLNMNLFTKRKRYQTLFLILSTLNLQPSKALNGLKSADIDDDPDSDNFEKYAKEEDRDAHVISQSLKRLIVRPENEKYPFVIKINTSDTDTDEVDRDKNEIMIKYRSPKAYPKVQGSEDGDAGPIFQEVTIKTSYIDMTKDLIVIPMGERGLGYPVKGAYVVFRKSSNSTATKHYMNLAYIRHQLKLYSVEWSILDASLFGKSRIDQEFCRRGRCDVFHHIMGTCQIASHKCSAPLTGNPDLIHKYMWNTNTNSMPAEEGPDSGTNTTNRKRSTDGDEGKGAIPNSLDLLLLKRHENEDPPQKASVAEAEDAHFENILGSRAVRSGPNIGMLDCNGCERMGEFLSDFEEDPEFSRLIGESVTQFKDDFASDIGLGLENDGYLNDHPGIPFVGFGHCNMTDIEEYPSNYSKEIEDLTKFFLASMRLGCEQREENRIRAMFTSRFKLLEIQEDYSIGLARFSPALKFKILTVDEFRTLMTGVFMAKYIQLYREEILRYQTNNMDDGPLDEGLSKGIRFLSKLILSIMDTFGKLLSQHFVRGHRFILRTLRDKFHMVLARVASDKASPLKDIWTNDLHRLMGLKEFILFGMGPLSKSGTKAEPAFRSFSSENVRRIKRLVDAYGIL